MSMLAAFLYVSGLPLALWIASDAPGPMSYKKLGFVAFWPVVTVPLFTIAMWKAVTE